jgi:integrase
MSSLYKKNNRYYLSVQLDNKRVTRSLRTDSYEVAKAVKSDFEKKILLDLINGEKPKQTPLRQLVELYLKADHDWRPNTLILNKRLLNGYLKNGFPKHPTTKSMVIRVLNACNNWGYKNQLIPRYEPIPGGNKYEARTRVYTREELDLMFERITPKHFNLFVQFAYYSGARSGEIRRISKENIFPDYIVVYGKAGRRLLRLNNQAKNILADVELWNYTVNYVQLTWSRNRKKLGFFNARFHDLRRTFGYNLIKQGRPIYEVSKLLGHSSVTTTEKHYAPLMVTEIEEFIL